MLLFTLNPPARSARQASRRGAAVLTGLIVVMLLAGLSLAFVQLLSSSPSSEERLERPLDVDLAASTAIALAVNQIWGRFEFQHRGERATPSDFTRYLDKLGLAESPLEDSGVSLLDLVDLPRENGHWFIGQSEVESLDLQRVDLPIGTRLTFTARVRPLEPLVDPLAVSPSLEHAEIWAVERSRLQGLDFALLSDAVNCAVCHLEVDSAARYYNRLPESLGGFPRARVGVLERLELRPQTQGSRIAGTLYLGRGPFQSDGSPFPSGAVSDLLACRFDGQGFLEESPSGDLISEPLRPPATAFPAAFENFYPRYGQPGEPLVDGFMPAKFPAVFPDEGGEEPKPASTSGTGRGNRKVDAAEFLSATARVDGTLSGGQIHVIPRGTKLSSTKALAEALNTGNQTLLEGRVKGHAILQGTPDDPLLLNGELAIDGDLVLSGTVKGTGTIKVRGNLYLPADLVYADAFSSDGKRLFGLAADGTANTLALAAGGNILVGDFFRPRWGQGRVTSDKQSSFSFVWEQIAGANKLEWIRSQPRLPARGQDPRQPELYKQDNPLYRGPDVRPRYYTFGPESPVPFLIGAGGYDSELEAWLGPESAGGWGSWGLVTGDPKNPKDGLLFDATGRSAASLSTILPSEGWLDEVMTAAMLRALSKSHDPSVALELDALLYTANGIFGCLASEGDPNLAARLLVNGSILAADCGLLASDGLRINYDPRAAALLDIVYDSELSIRRILGASRLESGP